MRKKDDLLHCVKSVRIRSYSGPYFPAFGPITPKTDTFHAVIKLTFSTYLQICPKANNFKAFEEMTIYAIVTLTFPMSNFLITTTFSYNFTNHLDLFLN